MAASMDSKKILRAFSELQAELAKNGPTARFRAARRNLSIIIRTYKIQLDYERLKGKFPDAYVEFFEPYLPMSAKDKECLEEAVAINRQIGKTLSALKKSKVLPET